MLIVGGHRAVRVRLGCAGALCVPRRARRGVLPPYSPLRRRLLLEAKRSGSAPTGADDGDDESVPAASSRGRGRGAADPADNLPYWEAQVAAMSFRDMQIELRNRGLSAGGRKDEVASRLAEALLDEHRTGGSGQGAEQQRQQQQRQEEENEAVADDEVEGDLLEAVLDRLDELPYNDLRRMCSERGLNVAGKKPDLQQRLAAAIVQSGEGLDELLGPQQEEEEYELDEQAEESSRSAAPVSAAAGGPVADDPSSLLPELLPLKYSELVALLKDYGAPVRGTKQELAMRLAECMVAEVKQEIGRGPGKGAEEDEQEYDEDEYEEGEYDEEEEEAEEAALRFDPASLSTADRKLLMASESRGLFAEHQGKTRQQLFNTLKQLQRNPSYQSRSVLLDQLVRFLADEKVEQALQEASSDPAAARRLSRRLEELRRAPSSSFTPIEAPAAAAAGEEGEGGDAGPPGAIDYRQLTPVDVRRMRVDDLRVALKHFGMDSSGNKYDMQERLMARVLMQTPDSAGRGRGRPPLGGSSAGGAGALASAAAAAAEQTVLGMTLRTLREELDKRQLPTDGSRNELQARLIAALRKEFEEARALSAGVQEGGEAGAEGGAEAGAAEAAEAVGETEEERVARRLVELAELPVEERGAAVVAAMTANPQSLVTLGSEAPVDVAVVAGCPPGRLDLAQRSLESARALLDHLYTAHMPSPMDGVRPIAVAEAGDADGAADDDADGEGEGEVAERKGGDAAAEKEEEQPEYDATLSYAPTAGGVARPSQGVVVSVWWLDGATGQSTLLSPAQVYAATAAELAAGCLPAVHRELLAVPPPSPLSLDMPALDGPVPATAAPPAPEAAAAGGGEAAAAAEGGGDGDGDGPSFFSDVTSLAAHLRGTAHVVFPAVPPGAPLYGELQRALEAEGVPHVGCGAEAAALAHDRVGVLQRLESLSYPVVPQLEVGVSDVAAAVRAAAAAGSPPAGSSGKDSVDDEEEEEEDPSVTAAAEVVRSKVVAWCKEQGLDLERQVFLVRPRHTASSPTAAETDTALGADRLTALLAGPLAEAVAELGEAAGAAAAAAAAASTVVIEPAPAASAARFVCTVVETPDGPVALLPSEVEVYDTEVEILKHTADVAEWAALAEGADDEQVAAARAEALAMEPEPWRAVYDPRVTLPATTALRLHTPPRLSRKLTHAMRHAAARLFSELGLRDVATVEGWVELPAGGTAAYGEALEAAAGGKLEEADDVPLLYDPDPYILSRIAEQEAERVAADPAPLEEYYDYGASWHADLSLFDPATRLNGATNGEGATVRIAGVAADLPLDARHPAVLQAAEVGLPHGALLRNLANNALRRAAAAGDRRALVPSEPYRSPQEALEAAAVEVILDAAAADTPAPAEEWAGPVEEIPEDEAEEVEAAEEAEEGEEEEEEEEDRVGLAAAAAAKEAAEPIELGPAPLQLPMPPQLPLYHTAVLQHVREADEYNKWIEDMDPDHWDDSDGPARVKMMVEEMEEQLEEATGLPRGYGDDPNPVAADMVSAVALEGHRMALNAAVDALGDFGATLSEVMRSVPLDEAVEADMEIPLTRVKDLPDPDVRLPDGIEGTAADPRVVAAWQMAAICELARRHGWEVLEAVDAEEEAAEREAAGIPEPTPEEEEAAAAAAAEERTVLEGMCDNDDEVMELRTGLITPVQLYLRFRERQARREPRSHPLMQAAELIESVDAKAAAAKASAEGEGEELGEGEEAEAFDLEAGEDEEDEEEAAGGVAVILPREEGQPEPEPGSEEAALVAAGAAFGPASNGPDLASPSAYVWNVPPDDAVELPVYASAGLTAAAMAVGAAVDGAEGSLAREVAVSGGGKLDGGELEALALMELGFETKPVDVCPETGLPVLAAIGPSLDGLHNELILDPFSGGLAQLPTFRPLAEIMQADGLEPATSSSQADGEDFDDDEDEGEGLAGTLGRVDWEDEDGFARGVARATAAARSGGGRVARASAGATDHQVEEAEAAEEEGGELLDEAEEGEDAADVVVDEAEEDEDDEEEMDVGLYPNPTVPLVAQALSAGDLEAAELAAVAPPLNPTRVWVVVGGDGHWGREAGLVAGANIVSKLSKYQDLVVEPFLMVPMGEGRNTDARRAELLRRRTDYIAGLGMDPEEDLPESMSVQELRVTPPMPTGRPETQCIYAVTLATVSRPSVPEALASLERTAARESVSLHALGEVQRQQRAAHRDVQAELAAAGMEGVASLWDDNVLGQVGPPPARPLDLASFAEDAERAGAVVLVAARGEMAECGDLQALLELQGVPCVGPGSQQLAWLWDRAEAGELLQDLHSQGVDAPPRFLLTWEEAVVAADLEEQEAEELLERLRSEVVEDPPPGVSLVVRPVADVAGAGVARLACGADVVTFMAALRDGDPTLPADSLSYPHGEIRMPPRPPPALAFELFVETDPLFMVLATPPPSADAAPTRGTASKKRSAEAEAAAAPAGAVAAGLHCSREKGWVEVSFALMGPMGGMSCLPPAMRASVVSEADLAAASELDERTEAEVAAARNAAEAATEAVNAAAERAAAAAAEDEEGEGDEALVAEERRAATAAVEAADALAALPAVGTATAALVAHAPSTWVVPPPEAALTAAALDEACKRAALIADRLGLRGLVQIEAFVAADSGELAVFDINGSPDLGPDSPIWRQAAAAGMLPQDFLRELLGLAITAATSSEGRRATYDGQIEALEREGWDLQEDETYDGRYGGDDEEEGELRLRGDGEDEDEEVESEGGRGGLGEEGFGEEDDMLGQLEELRAGAGAEEEGDAGGGGAATGAGDEGFLYFDDEEEDGGAGGGVGRGAAAGGGFMGFDEFSGGGGRGGGRGRGGFDDDDF
ncbi:hypothetical protein PLESTB_000789400 [Pleodorina starrii]|uniref:SAP domain-containing protein n=1 Tax=Pleodorina starrii TaxID=330485 RepID=A0A9W6BKR4_9CHLO|nr:hypothetical protein PLESTM_000495500 [Pleodorina starrii]GLC53808.1 hypothetical protein PLESTB_000789400 [Pleodorina starrii]GLC72988.1 hypothetical protein PLESTF_001317000 [Pleodorina starrii]